MGGRSELGSDAQQLGSVSSDDHREEREKQGAEHENNGDLGERMDSTADGGHGRSGARTGEQTEGGARAGEQAPRRGRRADERSRKQGAGASSKRGTGRSSGRAGAPRRHEREESSRQPRRRPNRNQGWAAAQKSTRERKEMGARPAWRSRGWAPWASAGEKHLLPPASTGRKAGSAARGRRSAQAAHANGR
jgi:hypothetical protein